MKKEEQEFLSDRKLYILLSIVTVLALASTVGIYLSDPPDVWWHNILLIPVFILIWIFWFWFIASLSGEGGDGNSGGDGIHG